MGLWLQKIIGFLLQPSSLIAVALLLSLRAGFGLNPRAARRWTLAALIMLVVFGMTALDDVLLAPLERRFPRPNLDAAEVSGIIVLGGSEGVGSDRALEIVVVNEAGERLIDTAILARRFPAARIVAIGGGNPLALPKATEAETTARALELLGVARSRLTLETTSRTTYENAVRGLPLIAARPGERSVLVTSAWHMPRAVGTFRALGLNVIAYPVDYQTSKSIDVRRLHGAISTGLGNFDGLIREYPALLYYRLLGRTDALFPAP